MNADDDWTHALSVVKRPCLQFRSTESTPPVYIAIQLLILKGLQASHWQFKFTVLSAATIAFTCVYISISIGYY